MKRLDLAFETVKQSALEDAPALQVSSHACLSGPIRPRAACVPQPWPPPNFRAITQVILRVRPVPPGKETCLALVPGSSKVQTTTPSNSVNFKILGEQVRMGRSVGRSIRHSHHPFIHRITGEGVQLPPRAGPREYAGGGVSPHHAAPGRRPLHGQERYVRAIQRIQADCCFALQLDLTRTPKPQACSSRTA